MWDNSIFTADMVELIGMEALEEMIRPLPNSFIPDRVSLRQQIQTRINLPQDLIQIDHFLELEPENPSATKTSFATFHLSYQFLVHELAFWSEHTSDGAIFLHPYLQNILLSISHSSSRGYIKAVLKNTLLAEFLLPISNPNELVFNP